METGRIFTSAVQQETDNSSNGDNQDDGDGGDNGSCVGAAAVATCLFLCHRWFVGFPCGGRSWRSFSSLRGFHRCGGGGGGGGGRHVNT